MRMTRTAATHPPIRSTFWRGGRRGGGWGLRRETTSQRTASVKISETQAGGVRRRWRMNGEEGFSEQGLKGGSILGCCYRYLTGGGAVALAVKLRGSMPLCVVFFFIAV